MALARLPIKTVVLLLAGFLGVRFAQNFIQSSIQFKNEDTLVAYFSQFTDQYLSLADLPDAETPPMRAESC
ncbi:MAG: hypothetical protein HYY57_03915 [Candidatus Omnitrophica bacterium]|nr:hypothetical protein [Candidatus Omnitrophota bacterium]